MFLEISGELEKVDYEEGWWKKTNNIRLTIDQLTTWSKVHVDVF